jgi:NADH-quinone oxidoreductase subunit C
MNNLKDLEKKINSELNTKIKSSEIRHKQLYLSIDCEDLMDVCIFI